MTVICDGHLKRLWTLTAEAATGDKVSMQELELLKPVHLASFIIFYLL